MRSTILRWLEARGPAQDELHREAREKTRERFQDRIIVRGVVEVTNRCRVNCMYCPMRKGNLRKSDGFLLTVDEIVSASMRIEEAGLNVVFLQGGEIPQTTELVAKAIPRIKEVFGEQVEILLCLGEKPREEFAYLRRQGAVSYILKHETSDSTLHKRLRGSPLESRLRALKNLNGTGFRTGTGVIIGLPGQTIESIADDLLLAQSLNVDMASVSPFVPAPSTPLASAAVGSIETTLNAIAAMRLLNPNWLIPAVSALEKIRPGAQMRGILAGGNVLTQNFTPASARDRYLIYGKDRFVVTPPHTSDLLRRLGLRIGGSIWT